jgi:hypothetical protein
MDIGQGHATLNSDMQNGHRHAAWTSICSQHWHGQEVWAWTCTMDMDMYHEHGHGRAPWTWNGHVPWTVDMQYWHGHSARTWTCRMNICRQQDFPTKKDVPHVSYSAQRSLSSLAPSIWWKNLLQAKNKVREGKTPCPRHRMRSRKPVPGKPDLWWPLPSNTSIFFTRVRTFSCLNCQNCSYM